MNKSFKVRIYPTEEQKILLEQSFGATRFIYNYFLNLKSKLYNNFKIKLNYNHMSKILTELKRHKLWLKTPDKCALQNTLKDLDIAYKNFFNGKGYPKFKKKQDKNSYRTNVNIKIHNRYIQIPKIGLLKFRDNYNFKEENILKIYNATISKTKSNKYFISISAEVYISNLEKTNQVVGIDLGVKDFAIFNTGEIIHNPRILLNLETKLRQLRKSLSRKIKGSSNYQKAKIKLAKFYEKVVNIRKDFIHKLSTNIIKKYDIICIEDLCIKAFIKSDLAKSFQDTALSEFIRQLKYKAEWYGKTIVQVNRFYPSSQLCSNCHYKNSEVKDLSVRKWTCPQCGEYHHRDINAAINILNEGLRIL